MRTVNKPADPALASTVRDGLDRVLAGQCIPLPLTADSLDSLNWEEVGGEVDWRAFGEPAMLELLGHRSTKVLQTSLRAPISQAGADQAVLDQYFAQTAAATDQTTDEE
jgi:hypothetical protein